MMEHDSSHPKTAPKENEDFLIFAGSHTWAQSGAALRKSSTALREQPQFGCINARQPVKHLSIAQRPALKMWNALIAILAILAAQLAKPLR